MKERFNSIINFIEKYSSIIDNEFIKKYPSPYPPFMTPWLNELQDWSFEDLAKLESTPGLIEVRCPSFQIFLKEINHLTTFKKENANIEPINIHNSKLSLKKQHEIELLKLKLESLDVDTIIDIGGGQGNLSYALTKKINPFSTICVDKDFELLERAKLKFKKENSNVFFEHCHFSEDINLKHKFKEDKSLIISLHGCGDLSNSAINFAIKNKISNFINFGCCYHKLSNPIHQSKISKSKGLHLTKNALHLASRCGRIINSEVLKKRYHFKSYRYSLHYFLNDHFNKPFSSLGNAKNSDYSNSFGEYAKKFSNDLTNSTTIQLDNFYNSEENKIKFHQHFLADEIRLLTGRVIEAYLIYDRAIHLEENNYNVQISELFDRELSPRNLMLNANRK